MTNTPRIPSIIEIEAAIERAVTRADQPDTAEGAFGIMHLVYIREQADAALARAVQNLRANGATWERVAAALGVSTQAAHKRYA